MLPWILFQFSISIYGVNSARILGLFSFPGTSHWHMIGSIMEELALRGHEVIVVSNFPRKTLLANYTDLPIYPKFDYWTPVRKELNLPHLYKMNALNIRDTLTMVHTISYTTTEYALEHPNVQKLIHAPNERFDLIIVEQFYQEAFLMFAHKYKVPVIAISTLGYINIMGQMMGNIAPWSHVPHEFVLYDDRMTIVQRFDNAFTAIYENLRRIFYYMPKQEELAQKYFSHLPGPLPSLSDLERNISVILLNAYLPLTTPRPRVMGMVEVGGVHIKDPKELPKDIKSFLDDAQHGAIYFSLGSNLKSSEMPAEKVAAILKVFSELKQRILWKWEDDQIPYLPKNVMIKSWMPQSDTLAHRNVKIFITHGGLLGTQEGVYRGVPFLGIPIYADQHLNMYKAVKAGYGVEVKFPNLTEHSFRWAINELLSNPMYATHMKETSTLFRDRPLKPMDEAIYWIEYVIRYRGAIHIRSSARELSWFSYFLLDILCLIVISIALIFYIVALVVKKFCKTENRVSDKQKKIS